MARKKRSLLPPARTPHDCVLVAIDPGAVSGYAIFVAGQLVDYGACKLDLESLIGVCQKVRTQSKASGLPTVLVAEKWDRGGQRWTPATMMGIGASWGAWRLVATSAAYGVGVSQSRVIRFAPRDWRYMTFGKGAGATRDVWKRMAQTWVHARFGIDAGPDAAEAICMGACAARAGEVGAVLPGRMPAGWFADVETCR